MQRLTWFLIVTLVIPYLGFTSYPVVSDRVDKVIIDAGHGGKDPGNLGTRRYKTYEKDVALAVAIETAKEIEKKYRQSIYLKKIGYVTNDNLKINIQGKEICNIKIEKLSDKFHNSIPKHL